MRQQCRRRHFLCSLVTLGAIAVLTADSSAARSNKVVQLYRMIDLGTCGNGFNYSTATAVNDLGQVVGSCRNNQNQSRAFLWQLGKLKDIGTPSQNAGASSINNRGQVVGFATAAGSTFPFLWQKGTMTNLRPADPAVFGLIEAADINERGQIAGTGYADLMFRTHGALWDGGVVTDLGTIVDPLFGLTYYSLATAVNNQGHAVGYAHPGDEGSTALYWGGGPVQELHSTFGGPSSRATDINDRGQVVGWAHTVPAGLDYTGARRAFIWENGVMSRLPGPDGWTEAYAINNRGQVVGKRGYRGVLWSQGVEVDLNAAGVPASEATDINELGFIVGNFFTGTETHAFLAIPSLIHADGLLLASGAR